MVERTSHGGMRRPVLELTLVQVVQARPLRCWLRHIVSYSKRKEFVTSVTWSFSDQTPPNHSPWKLTHPHLQPEPYYTKSMRRWDENDQWDIIPKPSTQPNET